MKKILLFGITTLFISSCTSENSKSVTPSQQVFNGYKITDSGSISNNSSVITSQSTINGNFQNDKFFSETSEVVINGLSQGVFTTQNYFYTNNLLDHRIRDIGTLYFYYDSTGRLIGATDVRSGGNLYERYFYNPNNIVYCESINLPYNNTNALVSNRRILQFDANNEVISAGLDTNFDGIMDNINNFSYADSNLISISYHNGSVQSFDYSTIIDNFNVITENSYGKKTLRLICSDSFCGLNYDLKYSKNILLQDIPLANYNVLSTNYYETKTEVVSSTNLGTINRTTQFYFN